MDVTISKSGILWCCVLLISCVLLGKGLSNQSRFWEASDLSELNAEGWEYGDYVKGEITAVAYDEKGEEIARDTEHSFGDPARIVLMPESTTMKADGSDLIFVEIGTVDADGYPVKNATNRIHVSVEGAGRLVGLDNGDSTDFDNYKATSRRLFSGKLLAVIAATKEPGEIVVRAASVGLPEETVTLRAEASFVPEGVSATEDNVAAEARWLAKKDAAFAEQWKKRMAEEVPVSVVFCMERMVIFSAGKLAK